VIGQPLNTEPIALAMTSLSEALTSDEEGSDDAAHAIMTTDTVKKEIAVRFELDGRKCTIGGIAKGSGMIHPNMATMLVFVTTDVAISSSLLQEAIREDVKGSFNMVSVDGDTSTNDMLCVLAGGKAQNKPITTKNEDYTAFCEALNAVTVYLSKMIARDGEGANRLIECTVKGADSLEKARKLAKSVISSSLTKAAIFGADANWGRVLCAMGYSGANFDVARVDISFKSDAGEITVCKGGEALAFDEELAKKILTEKEIQILCDIGEGEFSGTAWGCDLTYEYVRINGDYRT
jgi:glutamate N-acetyltransferase/amino-acid N-acetyltransferase